MVHGGLRRLALPGGLLAGILLLALITPWLPLPDPVRQDIAGRLAAPAAAHWLGQDEYGRDVLSRILWGARVSLSVAFAASLLAAAAGTLLGILGGYFRGVVELLTVRVAEVVLCFPPLLLALLVVTLLGPGATTLILSLAILFAPGFARVAYAETLSARALDYVTAQQALGARSGRILIRTLLPNIAPPLIVQFSLTIAAALLLESGLSFLGLGVVPPSPSWGLMIRGARATMEQAPLLLLWPCLALSGVVLVLNLFCDRLRDVLDPRGRTQGRPGFLRRIAALPAPASPASAVPGLLAVEGLTVALPGPAGAPLVRDVGFTLAPGETLAIVGESGSGKTMTALAIMGLLPGELRVVSGRILLTDDDGRARDLLRLPEQALRRLRGNDLAMVFQDPSASLNPLLRVGVQVAESLHAHGPTEDVQARVVALLREVGLPDPEGAARAYPHELSGGQRQRVMIAAAVANQPRLLLADEPTTALDVTVQAQILALLAALKRAGGAMGMVFVTHNLAVVAEIADRLVVMYAGEVVEEGPVTEVFAAPRHPYTAALMASMPEGEAERLSAIPGAVPQPWAMPAGCRFAPRCDFAIEACRTAPPALVAPAPGRRTRCLRWKELA
ncbi:dipeptide/oligopeptide/nickel ABC transporter permease/ATP-binding protein [Plastoroseomonas hellenica]|uniref:dipeptide/oligopeptide/nickel ABC transporter permease/ATP-binding protein n=1 Tax=Plastoroseomonas hellenica TaxID=2687306 RepID=UPI001BA4CA3E|nr:dipeptide/oligopeptide/nickel ABC transporter permease/ATP-binding protein [Plastoroseomonas hellenica]MBR0644221.1 dipeptide/oligopeptide/nickel ABC transporter permease/ATP-binding protein [Plastoroseomonas hellenica]